MKISKGSGKKAPPDLSISQTKYGFGTLKDEYSVHAWILLRGEEFVLDAQFDAGTVRGCRGKMEGAKLVFRAIRVWTRVLVPLLLQTSMAK